MAEDHATKTCLLIGPRWADKKSMEQLRWIDRHVLEPALRYFPQYKSLHVNEMRGPGVVNDQIIRAVIDADLVIADLSYGNTNSLYELGIRHTLDRPVIHVMLTEADPPVFDLRSLRVIQINPDDPGPAHRLLAEQIELLETQGFDHPSPVTAAGLGGHRAFRGTNSRRREQLAAKVDSIIQALADLRMNSIGEQLRELREISDELRETAPEEKATSLKDVAQDALEVVRSMLNVLSSKPGAEIVIAGAVAGIVSLGGIPAVTAYSLSLAALKGPRALEAALNRLPRRKDASKDRAVDRTSSPRSSAPRGSQRRNRRADDEKDKAE